MHRKALEIDEKLGRLEGMAIHYGNLGLVYEQRGDPQVPKAREYWVRAREPRVFAKIGMPHARWSDEADGRVARLQSLRLPDEEGEEDQG